MRRYLLITALLFSVLAIPASSQAAERLSGPVPGLVTQVIDGDTLEVRVLVWLDQEVVTRVRIDGIDTPEKRGKCQREKDMAEQARQLTETLLAEPGVTLHDIQHDKYGGRVRARVLTRSGRDVGEHLIAAGLARPYGGKARQTWCSVAQLP
ncbi:thermonuclease family protein [Skermanella rosea]|uniref:thermonuclease family protein n=1 Tax=Skermanella rosea TaxID=1817965 RepID=UPI001E55AF91|nr:thermonuclease family protein [Skermanella rosea]UEM03503.1 thermonuclease family protein [Skermanella rosea]